jgi:hypothetical protein
MKRATALDTRGFTPAQQGHYRPLVQQAWEAHAKRNGLAVTGDLFADPQTAIRDPNFRAWYEDELEAATGKRSTCQCDRKRDFTKAMAHFEAIVGDSIFWQMKLHGDDARRIAWNIREVVRQNDVDEVYMRGIARRMLRLEDADPLPELEQMQYRELLIIMGELKRFLRRGGKPGVHQHQREEALPF